MPNINVLIVEDEPIIAQDIKRILDEQDFAIVGIAYNSTKALDFLSNRNPDLVLLDIQIKGTQDGIEIAQIIQEKYKIPFIYITSHSDQHTLERAKQTLPYGFIVKPFKSKDVIACMEMAIYRHAQEKKSPFPSFTEFNQKSITPFTRKEFELLADIYEGMTNRQICEKRKNTINTVKFHIKNIFSKMDVKNRTAALAKLRNL